MRELGEKFKVINLQLEISPEYLMHSTVIIINNTLL